MAKKTLEEMLNNNPPKPSQSTSRNQGKRGKQKREFTRQEKTRLAIYWTILIVCLIGFVLMLVFVLNNNPLENSGQISLPSCTYVAGQNGSFPLGIFR